MPAFMCFVAQFPWGIVKGEKGKDIEKW